MLPASSFEPLTGAPARKVPADNWWTAGRFAVLLGLLIAVSFPTILLGTRTFVIRDFGLFGYPLAFFHRECFWRGEMPFWDPYNNCGIPFLAQWNTLTMYPFSLIYLLLPLAWSLPFFCLAHMFWAGLGMYQLAWRWTEHRLAAALAGLVFAFNGLTLNSLMWPNIVAALSWMPWVLWLVQRAWREGGRALVWAVLAGAMQMLAAGPEAILLSWGTLFVLACSDCFERKASRIKIPLRFFGVGALVALVCAAQLLPFLELLRQSQRDRAFSVTAHDWSMPFWGVVNFLIPLFRTTPTAQGVYFQNGQYWTSSYYTGIGTVLLALVAAWRVRERRVWLVSGLLLFGLAMSLGQGSLLYQVVFFCVPGIGFLRYPIKFVILVLAMAPLAAAFGLPGCARQMRSFEWATTLSLLLIMGAVVGLESTIWLPADAWRATWRSAASRGGFLVLFCVALWLFSKANGSRRSILGTILLLLVWLDGITHVPNQNPTAPKSIYQPGWAMTHENWTPRPGLGHSRVMLAPRALDILRSQPSKSLEETFLRNRLAGRSDANLLDFVPQIDGFFSLTPREIDRITQLPYQHPEQDFSGLLDFMAVGQTTAPGTITDWVARSNAMPMVTAGQEPRFVSDEAAFSALSQTNLDLRRAVFLPLEAQGTVSAAAQPMTRAELVSVSDIRIVLETETAAPSMVVISQTHYPAWKAYLEGKPIKIWRANYAFQAVEVPGGRHRLELRYEDRRFRAGAAVSALGVVFCLALWILGRRTPAAMA